MAQVSIPDFDPTPPSSPNKQGFLSKLRKGSQHGSADPESIPLDIESEPETPTQPGLLRRSSRKVIPGLPRVQTLKRQLSEQREHLAPVETSTAERRAISMDRRSRSRFASRKGPGSGDTRSGVPGLHSHEAPPVPPIPSQYATSSVSGDLGPSYSDYEMTDDETAPSTDGGHSESEDDQIAGELETIWILNLSMYYKDGSKREKFFVTYRQYEHLSRRVTVSLDYRFAEEGSLEEQLAGLRFQKDKSRKIYEYIRSSLTEIQFLDTVTNLKLETTDERLHVHVVEDGNEVIHYPHVSQLAHLDCRHVREDEINFESHLSGFVYKVSVACQQSRKVLIKKEIPSPEVIDEFLYEIQALHTLARSSHVIRFYGIVVDALGQHVKGLLIDFAPRGTLVDVLFDSIEDRQPIEWQTKERWARQIVHGLAEVHEAGFVQGDFTLSNIVVDANDDVKIIDINRRGCPVGWEPPELTPLIRSGIRIPMFIGVKSDLFQLGMVLYGLAADNDEPESVDRPLTLESTPEIPEWYRRITEICLSGNPEARLSAAELLRMFPAETGHHSEGEGFPQDQASILVEEGHSVRHYGVTDPHDGHERTTYAADQHLHPQHSNDVYIRGRSPTRDWRWNHRRGTSAEGFDSNGTWATGEDIRPSYSDIGDDDDDDPTLQPSFELPTPRPDKEGMAYVEAPADTNSEADDSTPVAETEGQPLDATLDEKVPCLPDHHTLSEESHHTDDDHLGTVPVINEPSSSGSDGNVSMTRCDADCASINTTASADTGVTTSAASTRESDITESSVDLDQPVTGHVDKATSTDRGGDGSHVPEAHSQGEPNDAERDSSAVIDHALTAPEPGQTPNAASDTQQVRDTASTASEGAIATSELETMSTVGSDTTPAQAEQTAQATSQETAVSHAEGSTATEGQPPEPPKVTKTDVVRDDEPVNDLVEGSEKVEPQATGSVLDDDDAPFYDAVATVQKTETPRTVTEHEDSLENMHNDLATHVSPDGLPASNALMTGTT